MADNNQETSQASNLDQLKQAAGQLGQPHSNAVVPHKIANHDALVQTSIWGGSDVGWINLNDTQDQLNMKDDLSKVTKVVQAQVDEIGKATKRANDAMDQANAAADSSDVNKAAIADANKAITEAQNGVNNALDKIKGLDNSVSANSAQLKVQAGQISIKADQTTVDAIKKTATDNSAAVSVLNDEVRSKVDSTTVNKIVDGKGFTTARTVQSIVDQKAGQLSQTITSVQANVDKNGKTISTVSDQLSNVTQTIDGLQTAVRTKADQSTINQLSNQLLAKVSTKDYQTEIAALTNAINLRVSKGDLISQINLEAGGDGLISVQNGKGKLMLDADSVVFGNKAFIPDAAIANLTADKITAGVLDVAKLSVKNFTADSISGGTLSGVVVKSGIKDEYFQTTKNNIYWVHNKKTSLIGTDTYINPGDGLVIADEHTIMLTTWWGAMINDDGSITNNAGAMGYPKIVIDQDGLWDPGAFGGADWGHGPGSQEVAQWVNDKEYTTLTQGRGFYVRLDDKSKDSGFIIQKDNCLGFYAGNDGNGNQINVRFNGNGSGFNIYGDLHVTGSKNSIVQTNQGYLAINAYETAEYYFGDIGENNTGNASQVVIGIDRIFNGLVNTSIQYQVFITPYSDACVWVEKRYNNRFVVKSDKPNAEFGWELKAKRKGYESNRLRRVNVDVNPLQLKGETK